MASAKKQGQASADGGGVPVPAKKKTRKEKSAENKAARAADTRQRNLLAETRAPGSQNLTPKDPRRVINYGIEPESVPYTPALEKLLFRLIATAHSLKEISEYEGLPELYVLLHWKATKDHPFGATYLKAKEQLEPLLEEMVITVSATPMKAVFKTTKQVLDKDGEVKTLVEIRQEDNVARSRLAADAYKWNLAVLRPKRYRMNETPETGKPNEQLEALFNSLKSGPVE